jgi:predicted ATPase
MQLQSAKIVNYQSLEQVKLDCLGQFNILIGRNNSGKSSIFSALSFLGKVVRGEGVGDATRLLTEHDQNRSLEIHLCFRPSDTDRADFVRLLSQHYQETRGKELLHGSFLRLLKLVLKALPGRPDSLHLAETSLRTEDDQWATIQQVKEPPDATNPVSRVIRLATLTDKIGSSRLERTAIDLGRASAEAIECRLTQNWMVGPGGGTPAELHWLLNRVARYFKEAFFFSPYRRSDSRVPAEESRELTQQGSNLAQILFTLNLNASAKYRSVEGFVQAALPDIGALMTPVLIRETEVVFQPGPKEFHIRLHEMGGGVEQLLMAATALATTPDTCALFLEEPEIHLHAGAQRFLIEKLLAGKRQVFLTTHSPVFVNAAKSKSLYQISRTQGRTIVKRVKDAEQLGAMLQDIGARNSDLLLSDAVLFVEGPGDKDTFEIWSNTLGMALEEHNVTVLDMHGGEYADRTAPPRSQVLAGISQQAPVEHLFIIDRDERAPSDVEELREKLGGRLHVLDRRELENYMLQPRAILAALRSKCHGGPLQEQLDRCSEKEVDGLIQAEADKLQGMVLVKRIRARLKGLPGGLSAAGGRRRAAPPRRDLGLPSDPCETSPLHGENASRRAMRRNARAQRAS